MSNITEAQVREMLGYLANEFQFEAFRRGEEGYLYAVRPFKDLASELGADHYEPLWTLRFSPSGRERAFDSDGEMYAFVVGMLTCVSERDGIEPWLATFDGRVVCRD